MSRTRRCPCAAHAGELRCCCFCACTSLFLCRWCLCITLGTVQGLQADALLSTRREGLAGHALRLIFFCIKHAAAADQGSLQGSSMGNALSFEHDVLQARLLSCAGHGCSEGICGSCAMNIDGQNTLACLCKVRQGSSTGRGRQWVWLVKGLGASPCDVSWAGHGSSIGLELSACEVGCACSVGTIHS